jgi:hypothetical protein
VRSPADDRAGATVIPIPDDLAEIDAVRATATEFPRRMRQTLDPPSTTTR